MFVMVIGDILLVISVRKFPLQGLRWELKGILELRYLFRSRNFKIQHNKKHQLTHKKFLFHSHSKKFSISCDYPFNGFYTCWSSCCCYSAAGDAGWGRGAAPAGYKDDATTRLRQTFAPGTHVALISWSLCVNSLKPWRDWVREIEFKFRIKN